MLDELLINLDKISLEVLIESILVFALTMLIKWPIKKCTSKFDENKRKALNTFIILIPIFLSVLISTLYSGYFFKNWFSLKIYETALSIYILSISIYAIFARVVIIVKGVKSGKNKNETHETIKKIETSTNNIINKLDIDKNKLESIEKRISQLRNLKETMSVDENGLSLITFEDIDKELTNLEKQKSEM